MRTLYLGKWLYTADAAGTVIEDFELTEGEQILWVKKRGNRPDRGRSGDRSEGCICCSRIY